MITLRRIALAALTIAIIAVSSIPNVFSAPVFLKPEQVFSLKVEEEPSKAAIIPPRLLVLCFNEPSQRSKIIAIDISKGSPLWNISLSGTVDKIVQLPGSSSLLLTVTSRLSTVKVRVSLYLLSPQGKLTKLNETTVLLLRREEGVEGWNPFYSISPNKRFLLVEVGHVIVYCIDTSSTSVAWAHRVKVGGILYGVVTNSGSAYLITIDTACDYCIYVEKLKWLKFIDERGNVVSNYERSFVLGGTFVAEENKAVLVNTSGQVVFVGGLNAGQYKENAVLNLERKIKGLSFPSRRGFAYGSLPSGRYLYFFAEDVRGPGVFAYDAVSHAYKWVPLTAMNVTARNIRVQGWDDGIFFVLTEATTRPQIVLVDMSTGQQLVLVSSKSHTPPSVLFYSIDTKTIVLKLREKSGCWLVKVLRLVEPEAKTHTLMVTVRGERGEKLPFTIIVNGTVFYSEDNISLTLPEGTYEVIVSAEGHTQRREVVRLTRDLDLSFTLRRTAHELLVRVVFSDGGSLEGIVRIIANNGSVVASSSLRKGLAVFTLPEANYTVEVYANETLLVSKRVCVTDSGELNIVIPMVTFCFHVKGEEGTDIRDARVVLSDLNGVVRYESSGGPTVRVRAINGTYLVKIMAEGYIEREFEVSGAKGDCRLVVLKRRPKTEAGSEEERPPSPYAYAMLPPLAVVTLGALLIALRKLGFNLPGLRETLSKARKEKRRKRPKTRARSS